MNQTRPTALRTLLRSQLPVLAFLALLLAFPSLALADEASEAEEFAKTLEKGWLWAYLVAFGTGVVTSLTPCVYPMIPITVALFGSKDEGTTRGKSFLLATCYVGGMGILFAVLGTAFAMAGGQAGSLLANPRVIVPLALLLLALATSMFGAFDIQLPSSLQARLNQVGGKGYGGAFGMGLVGGLIAAPCTGPFLAGMLVWVASTGNPIVGATMLFTYALGVGVLFFVIAVTSMSLPKSGAWMEGMKSFGGLGLMIAAIHFLRPVVPQIDSLSAQLASALGSPTQLLMLGVALAIVGIVAGSVHLSFHGNTAVRVRKGIAVGLTVAGVTLAVSGVLTPERILEWRHDEAVAFADAKSQNKGVMIDFGATWCAPCKLIEKVMGESEVYDELNSDFIPLKFDVSDSTDADQALQARYKASALPAVLFLDADGTELIRYNEKSPETESMLRTIGKAKTALRQK